MPNNIFNYLDNESVFTQRTLTSAALSAMGGRDDRIIKFPESLGQSSVGIPFVAFAPYKRPEKIQGFTSLNPLTMFTNLPSPEFVIALPVPASALKTSYGVDYQKYDMGQGIGALAEIAAGGSPSQSTLNELTSALSDVLGQAAYAFTQGALGVGGVDSGVLNSFMGRSENPYTEQLFKNVEFRTHTFAYTFIPKNEAESRRIDQIIQMFKFYMLPVHSGTSGGISPFFSFPYEFQITYSVSDTTFTLLPSVLEKFDVDYAGYDIPKFFNPTKLDHKQYPAKITMTMVFREMALLTRDRIALDLVEGLRDPVDLDYDKRGVPINDQGAINRTRFRF